jgi:hypothetical protein
MQSTLYLAGLFGPMILLLGVGMLLGNVNLQKIMRDFESNAALVYIAGAGSLILGIILVNYHNTWNGAAEIIISIFAWGALVKGIGYLAFPNHMFNMAKGFMSAGWMQWSSWILLALGGYLSYISYLV